MEANFPSGKIKEVSGKCLALKGDDIDTDRIIPARFLKCVSFQALGEQVFADDRSEVKGSHPFDQKENQGSSILIVNNNFGCGSSREHAPQALMRWGIRGIVGESFAEIFYGNCLALGIPCFTSSSKQINELQASITTQEPNQWVLQINEEVIKHKNIAFKIKIESGSKEMLTTGKWDATSQLISEKEKLTHLMKKLPYLNNFSKT
ncbi:3-isopropylmalate dehydratase small subunit [Prochlorococcus sp. MIT 1223]|uniref:3-isopropylmalate dehydratase small subunit n=1 Tax=Prochlorococcus sp. MIT 1223 TaxID=3096217 RepID=UPI002A75917E|nr:3-isopropylmalate dehydratase small subunit [Prochlorococcus sp. MIT 1223]